ncbi:hypothetical protein GCM10023083_43360 [Streptomyces phyllanthi]
MTWTPPEPMLAAPVSDPALGLRSMEDAPDTAIPRWLDHDEQQQWYAFAYVLTQPPAALEARMQHDFGIAHFGTWCCPPCRWRRSALCG